MKTDPTYWEQVQHLVPEFMSLAYVECEGWRCGVIASVALRNFHKFVAEKTDIEISSISYHTFYQSLRALGYDLPTVKGERYDANKTKIKGIARKEL